MLLLMILDIYAIVVFAAVILSWFNLSPDNPIMRVVTALTEPVLGPIRRVMPNLGGIDLSPMVLLIGITMVRRLLVH